MERTLVIKLLGRSITYVDLMNRTQNLWKPKGSYQLVDMERNFYFALFDLEKDYAKALTGGLWTIFRVYLMVQPWTIDFDPTTNVVSTVAAWQPLIPWIKGDGKQYGVEYEGLPLICFSCGKYGHTKDKCQGLTQMGGVEASRDEETMDKAAPHNHSTTTSTRSAGGPLPEQSSSQYGSWMQDADMDHMQFEGIISSDSNASGPGGDKWIKRSGQVSDGGAMRASRASGQAKQGNVKKKYGASKPVQEYRIKVPLVDPVAQALNEANKELNKPSKPEAPSSGRKVDKVGGKSTDVGSSTKDLVGVSSEGSSSPSLAIQTVESMSSLDRNHHTVVMLQHPRQVLEEVKPSALNIMTPL
ncbi:hypothetical protein K1719_042659 [Acacia pycnantha]|nr:hypothetical protein K1719_042659 [Acacia pycnantha]